jgi:phosphoribosylaminoimidazolecarboxamide formyltransferase/IMP cyclohydrolase
MSKRALISVSDKTGVVEFADALTKLGYEIISTGGTAKALSEAKIKVIPISDITGFPECLDGRVKTLHPFIHGGLLAVRSNAAHIKTLKEFNISTIDIVAVNLYPFKEAILKQGLKEGERLSNAIENIDIGGPAMIRSAAKNYQDVVVLTDPGDYGRVIEELKLKGDVSKVNRFHYMYKAFAHTAQYDSLISGYFAAMQGIDFPQHLTLSFNAAQSLRYGENPHQNAMFYRDELPIRGSITEAKQLNGKELSFNNIYDAARALDTLREFSMPTVVAVKHNTACGVASAANLYDAYLKAYECDPVSIFGGIVAANGIIEKDAAEEMSKIFLEIIIAKGFTKDALEILSKKKNIRLLSLEDINAPVKDKTKEIKWVLGGLLVQDVDEGLFNVQELKTVTKVAPTKKQLEELEFAFKVVKHIKSNAIVLSKDGATVGIGTGQTNRIWAANQAIEHAGKNARGSVMASDAFFPFEDVVEAAANAGITAIIQPGGSQNDLKSIEACDKHGIAMVMCGQRHFKH